MGMEEMDEPTSPGADVPQWWEDVIGAVVAAIIATLVLEALDSFFFRTDLPWQVCAGLGVIMSLGAWVIFVDAERRSI